MHAFLCVEKTRLRLHLTPGMPFQMHHPVLDIPTPGEIPNAVHDYNCFVV